MPENHPISTPKNFSFQYLILKPWQSIRFQIPSSKIDCCSLKMNTEDENSFHFGCPLCVCSLKAIFRHSVCALQWIWKICYVFVECVYSAVYILAICSSFIPWLITRSRPSYLHRYIALHNIFSLIYCLHEYRYHSARFLYALNTQAGQYCC